MPQTDISRVTTSSLATNQDNYSITQETIEGAAEQKETYWENTNWTSWLGYYKHIPELHNAINTKAAWTVGRGYQADETTQLLVMKIKGWGKDTFNSILKNLMITSMIGGDAFAEIITDDDDQLINLKPLDPSTIRIVANRKGRIIRYEQIARTGSETLVTKTFKPEHMFHLCRNRICDEIHGTSIIEALQDTIDARNEAFVDWRRVLHRNVNPVRIWSLDTDNATEINTFISKTEAAIKDAENIYIPKGTAEVVVGSVAPNATLNPTPWIEQLNGYFNQNSGVPDVIAGNARTLTEAASKIVYLVFQQTVEEEQLFLEEQILSQLNMEIIFNFPASLDSDRLSGRDQAWTDQDRYGAMYDTIGLNEPQVQAGEQALEPNDQMMEMEGKK